MILITDEYHVDMILSLSFVVIGFVPFLGVCLLAIPLARGIHQIFLVLRFITLPLWLIMINHFEFFLGGGILHLFTRSIGFYVYSRHLPGWLPL
jgi:hypothetical protein